MEEDSGESPLDILNSPELTPELALDLFSIPGYFEKIEALIAIPEQERTEGQRMACEFHQRLTNILQPILDTALKSIDSHLADQLKDEERQSEILNGSAKLAANAGDPSTVIHLRELEAESLGRQERLVQLIGEKLNKDGDA